MRPKASRYVYLDQRLAHMPRWPANFNSAFFISPPTRDQPPRSLLSHLFRTRDVLPPSLPQRVAKAGKYFSARVSQSLLLFAAKRRRGQSTLPFIPATERTVAAKDVDSLLAASWLARSPALSPLVTCEGVMAWDTDLCHWRLLACLLKIG